MSKLIGNIERVVNLQSAETDRMFFLLQQSFDNVQRTVFDRDLAEKDCVVIVRSADGNIQGFSTLKFFWHDCLAKSHRLAFSGDTIISRDHWGSLELSVMLGVRMMQELERDSSSPLWWLLISKGVRTFKCLPAFFRQYYPNPTRQVPPEIRALMTSLGIKKYGQQYDIETGVIRQNNESYCLRPSLIDTLQNRRSDPIYDFFHSVNPYFYLGAELLCLAQFDRQNLNPLILRLIDQRTADIRSHSSTGDRDAA